MNKNKNNPLVSIIIPVYNGENYLEEAIQSALNQTYKNIEVIVINDGSTDKTDSICKKYKNKIHYIKKTNGGVASALNVGIKNMKGKYFSWLSHDDLYDKNKIKEEIALINNLDDEMALVTCNYDFINQKGKFLYCNKINKELLTEKKALIYFFNYSVNGCALLINKKYFDTIGLFNENLPTTQDFDMWFRLLANQELHFIDKYLVHSRVHDKQGSKTMLVDHVSECDNLWIGFVKSLNKKQKEDLYGSEYDFYDMLQKTLRKYVNYPNVFEFLELEKIKLIKQDDKLIKQYLRNNYNYSIPEKYIKLIRNKDKIRVLFGNFGTWEDRGGLNRVVANIANNISKKYETFIISYGRLEKGYHLDKTVNFNFWKICGNMQEKLFYLLKLFDIDIYINPYNCIKSLVEMTTYVNNRGIKSIAWNHEYYFLPYYNSEVSNVVPVRNELFKNHSLVLWLTTASKIIYDQFAQNSIVMNNALTINDKLNKSDFNDNSLISIGRFDDQRKCAETLIILAKKLKDANVNVKIKLYGNYNLNLIGFSTHKKLCDLISEYNLTDKNIEFMGFINNIEDVLKHSKVNLLLSYHEGFGLTIIEAASYGIPTIAFNDSGFEDMIINGYNGYLLERDNYELLVETIKNIYSDDALFNKLSNNAQQNVEKFSINKIVDRWYTTIDALVNNDIEKLNELKTISNDIDKNIILSNGIKEYEKSIEKILKPIEIEISEKIDTTKKSSIFRKLYRKIVPLSIRKKIKKSKRIKKIIKFDE